MIFGTCCIVISTLLFILYLLTRRPHNYPPGPAWLPVLGMSVQYWRLYRRLGYHHLVWATLAGRYGRLVGGRLGGSLVVCASGPAAVHQVLTRDEFEGRPDGFFFRLRTFGGRLGIVFTEGVLWQRQRRFSVQQLRRFGLGRRQMEERIAAEARELVAALRARCTDPATPADPADPASTSAPQAGTVLDLHASFDVAVVNVLWAMLAGRRFPADDPRLARLLAIVHDAFRLVDMSGGLLNQFPVLRHLAPRLCGYTAIVDNLSRMWAFLDEAIKEHKETLCESHVRDLIDAFLHEMHMKSDPSFTDEQLMILLLDLFMAGSETTSNTLSFAVIYMLRHPHVQRRVQQEMDAVVTRNRWPTLQDRPSLKYTEAVLMEVQRHANVPPFGIAHRTVKAAKLLGYDIPAGAIVLASLYSVHMDPDHWGDPHVFRPDRFLDPDGNIAYDDRYFIPFGTGKRRCLGESLAKANYFLIFTTLLHNFHLEQAEEGPPPDLRGYDGVTISPKPFAVKLTPRID